MFDTDILLIDKPKGITSFDVIRTLRKRYTDEFGTRAPKMGHAGTLDPLASGLMIVGVGEGTKKLTEYIKLDKEYLAEILIGQRRATGDMEGEVLEDVEVSRLEEENVVLQLTKLQGTLRLPVSAYSAIKSGGVPFYKRARKAETIGELIKELPIRDMHIYETEFLGMDKINVDGKDRYLIRARFFVASGTYIRSLAEELGNRLGYPATLYNLRRTKIGDFSIEDATPV